MLQQEREHLASLAVERVSSLFNTQLGGFYEDGVKHKLLLLLQAVDRAALAANKPMLFAEIVPGFDLIILQNPDAVAPVADGEQIDTRSLSSVDDTCLAMLGQAINKHLAESRGDEAQEGVFVFKGGDGLHYFGFKALYRHSVLKEMGVSENGLVSYVPGSGVMQ